MRTLNRLLLALQFAMLSVLASGCAAPVPRPLPPTDMFSDELFARPAKPPSADDLFTLSPAMREYLHSPTFTRIVRDKGPTSGLIDALYNGRELKLEYDASITRNAAETYEARMGNCMSLVVMTAAFARELGLQVNFQDVAIDQVWSRSGNIQFANTHVNLTLARSVAQGFRTIGGERSMTVDFIPTRDAESLRTHLIEEDTIRAMYMNNRAAELLAEGKYDEAYWWARNALASYPGHLNLYNTLGVIYHRHGDRLMAEKVYRAGLLREPENLHLMHNLVPLLALNGKQAESLALAEKLKRIDPRPPFYYFALGQKAMVEQRWEDARSLFAKEVRRSPYSHEFHFWLALAQLQLGDVGAAREQLTQARETANTQVSTQRYSDKLAHLRMLTTRRF
jgi:tetratricopeptide (TPR) repeat protein